MYASILLVGSAAVAVLASTAVFDDDPPPSRPQAAQTVDVNVRIDCLAGRGVSFSLMPWAITVQPGDSVAWRLDPGSNVDSMDVVEGKDKTWPFKRKPPYKTTKAKAGGGQSLDPNEKGGKYQYAVRAVCVRSTVPAVADTILIDPDMIIIRG